MEGNLYASSGWGWCQAHCQLDEEEDEDMKKKDSKSKHGSVKPLKCFIFKSSSVDIYLPSSDENIEFPQSFIFITGFYFSQKTGGSEIESQSNLNEAELNILNDKECARLGTYKDIVTKQVLTASIRKHVQRQLFVPCLKAVM